MGRRVLILSASVGSGHNMAATALESYLKQDPEVDLVGKLDVLETTNELYRSFYDDAYFTMVEAVPWLVGWGYDANDPPFKLGNSISLWDRISTTETVREIKAFRPDVVICTHFLPTRLITLMITRGSLDATLAVVTTDYDFAGLWLSSPFHHFFVAREETRAHMVAIGVPADRVSVSGIPVRTELGQPVNREAVLDRHDLDPDLPILLISAGAAGGTYTKSIVRQTMRMRNRFQAVVVCGRNDQLKTEIEAIVAPQAQSYRVLGYTKKMADLVRVATLFVGKPGGLSSSECMAAGLPMVLIKPIPGQEVRNSDFLLEEGAAVRCNYDTTVGWKIDALLDDPERIRRMAANARRIGHPDAAPRIVSTALGEQPAPVWISHAAQRAILAATEAGIAAVDLDAERRIRSLVDPRTGRSVGVVTQDQLDRLARTPSGGMFHGSELTVTERQLKAVRSRLKDPSLMLTLRRILGPEAQLTLEIVR